MPPRHFAVTADLLRRFHAFISRPSFDFAVTLSLPRFRRHATPPPPLTYVYFGFSPPPDAAARCHDAAAVFAAPPMPRHDSALMPRCFRRYRSPHYFSAPIFALRQMMPMPPLFRHAMPPFFAAATPLPPSFSLPSPPLVRQPMAPFHAILLPFAVCRAAILLTSWPPPTARFACRFRFAALPELAPGIMPLITLPPLRR
jgi:hypothetical protein